MIKADDFKIRCSQWAKIAASPELKSPEEQYKAALQKLEDMKAEFRGLSEKAVVAKEKLKAAITKLGWTDLPVLEANRSGVALPAGAITYCQQWVTEKRYARRQTFTNKYVRKGIEQEDGAIEFAAGHYGWGLVMKNTERRFSDYSEGECDIILSDRVVDIKNSWSCFTFPAFDTKIESTLYEWQGQGYVDKNLFDRPKFQLTYTLMDAPQWAIDEEYWKQHRAARIAGTEVDEDLYNAIEKDMLYSHLPAELRIKSFEIDRDEAAIKFIQGRVLDCRRYIQTII